jgi:putative ABC transport system permease protein
MFFRLALFGLWSRKGSVLLTFLAITVSVFVLLGVEQIRHHAKNSFGNTVSVAQYSRAAIQSVH